MASAAKIALLTIGIIIIIAVIIWIIVRLATKKRVHWIITIIIGVIGIILVGTGAAIQ